MDLGKKNLSSVFRSLSLSISLFNLILMAYIHDQAVLSQQSMSKLRNRAMDSSNMA